MIKVFNLVDPVDSKHLKKQNYEKIYKEIRSGFETIVEIKKAVVVTNEIKGYGAEPGCMFFELKNKEDSELIIKEMSGKSYEKREIEIVCVPEEMYVSYYLNLFGLK